MSAASLECGAIYWMPDPVHVVRPVILTSSDQGEYRFDHENGTKITLSVTDPKLKLLTRVDPQCIDTSIDDLISLNSLSENALLHILRGRFADDNIYTSVSSILIAVNPFKSLEIYSDEVVESYRTSKDMSSLPPHIFRTTDNVYRGMLATSKPHSIIISGESGAGKTETIKFVLRYLTRLSEAASLGGGGGGGGGLGGVLPASALSIQDQIMQSNVILEAFGNAKTARNNNSSRFGKLITLQFSKGVMRGAEIISYLLEKSRVVCQAEGEGSYHVFYQLLSGCHHYPQLAQSMHLDASAEYAYLCDSQEKRNFVESSGVRDLFDDLVAGLGVIGVSEGQRADIFRVLAVILRMGNTSFSEDKEEESVSVADERALGAVCALAGLPAGEVSRSFTTRQFGVRSIITCQLTLAQATAARDAFTKAMYSYLFDWLVEALNRCMHCKETAKSRVFIAVLDIFGFEAFKENSFEQLLINYCNEKLLAHFNSFIFVMEQEEYAREGITFDFCHFKDNAPTIALLEKSPFGLIALLDEEIVIPKGSDEKLLEKIFSKHMKKDLLSQAMSRKETNAQSKFVLNHFAGEVAYDIRGFLEKNRDAVPPSFLDIGASSSIPFIADLFKKHTDEAIAGGTPSRAVARGPPKRATLAGTFKKELASLVDTLNHTTPRFVRCMKSNMQKTGGLFESEVMLKQLRYSGLLEVCRIRQGGFPTRMDFDLFLKGYWTLHPGASSGRELVECLRKKGHFDPTQFQLGATKVFFKTEAIDTLNNIRFQQLFVYASRIQAFCKGFLMRIKWKKILAALVQLAEANAAGKEEDLMVACNLVSETVPHQGLHLQVMLDSLLLIEKLQGEDGEEDEDEERSTEGSSSSSEQGRLNQPPPPAPHFPPPPPPKDDDFVFDQSNEPLPKPIADEPVVRKIITRRVSQEGINIAESLQQHIETLFANSKSRDGLTDEQLVPLNEAIAVCLECENIGDEDIGLLNQAANELERATLQLVVQRKIEKAVLREEKDVQVLRALFCEGNELGMNNYEGMLVVQQVIQRKALKETTTGRSGKQNDLQELVARLKCKSQLETGVTHQDLAEVQAMLTFLLDKYGECSLAEVQIARQEVERCTRQIEIQEALAHVSQRTPRRVLKELWKQGKEVGMTEHKGFKAIDELLYPELSAGAPNVIKIIDGLRAQAGSARGVSQADIDALEGVIKRLEAAGLTTVDKSFRIASKLLAKVTKQSIIQNALSQLTNLTPLTAKQSLWRQGCKLHMEKYEGMVALRAMLGEEAAELSYPSSSSAT